MNTAKQMRDDPPHILIAEDSPTQAELLKYALERHGYMVTTATNGRQAMELARALKPTLVISDVLMPEMDGYQLCQEIKTDAELKDIPVILLTTLADPRDVIRGLESRADNFIIKPYEEQYLLSRVQFVLLNKEIRQHDQTSMGVEIHFHGQRHFITADRLQILNLLLSTYEAAVQRNQELSRARDDLHAASSAKSDFLANMSHEIRTPMTAILGYADMLLDESCSAKDRVEHVHVIRQQAEHLLAILNDILDLSKIEAGKLTVESLTVDPRQIVNEAVSLLRAQATERKLELEVIYASPVPKTIRTDPTRMRQLLINLMGNAIKFTKSGSVKLILTMQTAGDGGQSHLEICVIDTGIGMTPQQMQSLFKPFSQADNSTTRRFGGTGLGLTICRHLAHLLGGDIAVESKVGVGSQFKVTIKTGAEEVAGFAQASRNAAGMPESNLKQTCLPAIPCRILLAEDGIHNQKAITYYLSKSGADVTIAENGKVARNKALSALAYGNPFDVILMDMQMPEMDGYEATASLRHRGYEGPIIALTAHAMSHDRARCIKAGCTDYLTKPIDHQKLILMVASYLHGGPDGPNGRDLPAELLRSTAADDAELAQLLPEFVGDLPQMVTRLIALLDANKRDELHKMVHQLKGTAGVYGFMPLTEAAERVDLALVDGQGASSQTQDLISLIRNVEGYEAAKEARRTDGKWESADFRKKTAA